MKPLIEYAHSSAPRYQVYYLTGQTYVCERSHEWVSDAHTTARALKRKALTVKLYDACAQRWLPIPR